MDPIIKAEHLSKRYRIGVRAGYTSLRDAFAAGIRAPLRRLRQSGERGTEVWALKDVSFEVAPGEVVGIIGRNGAGKSTLLKIFSRITKPTKGRVVLNGRVEEVANTGGFILGLAFDGEGLLYACDLDRHEVVRVNVDTGNVDTYSSGTADVRMRTPNYPAFDARGSLYVTDSGETSAGAVYRASTICPARWLAAASVLFPVIAL